MAEQPPEANRKEKFDVLYKSLADYSDKFVGRFLSVLGFQLVGLGWLLTSAPAQTFFKESETGAILAIVLTLVIGFSFPPSILRVWNVHKTAFQRLQGLNYMPQEYYRQHLLPPWYLPVAMGIIGVQYLALCGLIAHWHWKILG